jgi:catechol 2,3-dioxygenase-like lactoylglutathione lyase family enzyme
MRAPAGLRFSSAATHDGPTVIRIRGLDHFVLRVRDLEASLRFYRDVLGLPVESLEEYRQGTRPFVSVRIGDQLLDLVPDATYDSAASGTSGFLHFCVTADGDFASVVRALAAAGAPLLHDEPVVRSGARGQGLSIYARDPDGYVVELKEH